jgi:hypothetical protein
MGGCRPSWRGGNILGGCAGRRADVHTAWNESFLRGCVWSRDENPVGRTQGPHRQRRPRTALHRRTEKEEVEEEGYVEDGAIKQQSFHLRVKLSVPERLSATGAVHSKVPGQVQKCSSAARTLSAACPFLERDSDAIDRHIGIRCPGAKEMDESEKKRQANDLQRELTQTGLSRRAFLDRLTTLGVGFGAASIMGANDADAHGSMDKAINVQSTNPALSTIIEEGRQQIDEGLQNVAEYGGTPRPGGGFVGNDYGRGYSRAYSRSAYERYARAHYERAVYTRYNRVQYTRYNRVQYSRYARSSYSRYGGGGSGGGGWGSGGGGYGGGGGGYGGR